MKDEKRRERLIELLNRLESGVDVQTRDMKIALTEKEFKKYEDLWDAEKANRKIIKTPDLKKYELMIKQAYAADARAEKYRINNKFKNEAQKLKMGSVSNGMTDIIFSYYEELVGMGYADCFVNGASVDPDLVIGGPKELPVLKGSKSFFHDGKSGQMSKRDYKKIVIQEAIDNIDGVIVEVSVEEAANSLKSSFKKRSKTKFTGFKV